MTQNEAELVRKLIQRLGHESFGTGPLAELRRMDPARPAAAPAALHRLLADHPDDMLRGSDMDRWTLLVHLFALAAPELHRGGGPLGEALFRAGYSEGRLIRLLQSEDEALTIVLPRLVRFLTAKRERLQSFEFAQLVLWRGTEQDRLRIARDFYRAEAKKPEAA